jgi:hypothetical protein
MHVDEEAVDLFQANMLGQIRVQLPWIKRRLMSEAARELFTEFDFIDNIMSRSKSDYWKLT